MKIRDAVVTMHGTARDKLQHIATSGILEMAQIAHETGLSPLEVLECLCMAAAHVADIAGKRKEAAQFMRAWADDLEKTDVPVAIKAEGSA